MMTGIRHHTVGSFQDGLDITFVPPSLVFYGEEIGLSSVTREVSFALRDGLHTVYDQSSEIIGMGIVGTEPIRKGELREICDHRGIPFVGGWQSLDDGVLSEEFSSRRGGNNPEGTYQAWKSLVADLGVELRYARGRGQEGVVSAITPSYRALFWTDGKVKFDRVLEEAPATMVEDPRLASLLPTPRDYINSRLDKFIALSQESH